MNEKTVMRLGATPSDTRYLNLGRAIAGQCPAGFEEARLEADFDGGDPSLSLACTPEGGAETGLGIDASAQAQIRSLLAEIRDYIDPGGRAWRRCIVTLRKGGRFAMDVEY